MSIENGTPTPTPLPEKIEQLNLASHLSFAPHFESVGEKKNIVKSHPRPHPQDNARFSFVDNYEAHPLHTIYIDRTRTFFKFCWTRVEVD